MPNVSIIFGASFDPAWHNLLHAGPYSREGGSSIPDSSLGGDPLSRSVGWTYINTGRVVPKYGGIYFTRGCCSMSLLMQYSLVFEGDKATEFCPQLSRRAPGVYRSSERARGARGQGFARARQEPPEPSDVTPRHGDTSLRALLHYVSAQKNTPMRMSAQTE